MGNLIKTPQDYIVPTQEAPGYPRDVYFKPDPIDVRRVWDVLVKRKLLISLVTLLVLVAAVLYSFLTRSTYRSTASIQIEPEAAKVLPYNAVSDSLVKGPGDFELYMKTQDELLRSPTLAAQVVDRITAKYKSSNLPIIGSDFSSGMDVVRLQESQIVQIGYESYDPQFSALAANTIAEEFINFHFERKVDTTRRATEFLQQQLVSLKKKVEDAEAELVRYAASHNILDVGGNQENVIRARFGLLNTQVTDSERAYIARRIAFEELKSVSPETFPSRLRTQEIVTLETKVLQSEQDLSSLRVQFGENWPAVVQKKQELALAQKQFAEAKREAISRARKDAEINYISARDEYEMLRKSFKDQQQLVNRLNESSIQYNALKREADASEQLFQGLMQRLKETGVSAALELGNIHITDPAKARMIPYKPRPAWNISLGLLLGLSAGIGLAFFLEYADRSLRNPADLESLGIPLLGWIPAIVLSQKQRAQIGQGKTKNKATTQLSTKPSISQALAIQASQIWDVNARESYRSVIASLLLSKAERPAQSILITSACPREGKTTTVINLGATLAEIGSRTLLIDADFRNPSLSHRFNVANGKGLSVYLAGGSLDIRETSIPNLYVLPSGPYPPNPVALLVAERFAEMLATLKHEFQYVLVDSPPVLSLADASVLASKVDGVILVVKSGEMPQEVIVRANLQLKRSGGRVLGAAVNSVNLRNPEYRYYKKYYYDQRYMHDHSTGKPIE